MSYAHSQTEKDAEIVCLILAGGQGSRLGGVDKGLQLLNNKPLIEYVLEALGQQVSGFILSVNQNLHHYQSYGYPLIEDGEKRRHKGWHKGQHRT